MALKNFEGNTFVAFIDISGFTAMMREGRGERAVQALDTFYAAGYRALNNQQNQVRVDGLFVSDCGILFARLEKNKNTRQGFESLLKSLRLIHEECFRRVVSLTSSVAWGGFSYHNRVDFPGIEKNPFLGNAYVEAFKDNNGGTPKMYPNECRIINEGLPEEIVNCCNERVYDAQQRIDGDMRFTPKHFYYEWMRRLQ